MCFILYAEQHMEMVFDEFKKFKQIEFNAFIRKLVDTYSNRRPNYDLLVTVAGAKFRISKSFFAFYQNFNLFTWLLRQHF